MRRTCSRRRNSSPPSAATGLRVEAGEFFDDPEGLYPAGAVLPGPVAKLAGPTYEERLNQ